MRAQRQTGNINIPRRYRLGLCAVVLIKGESERGKPSGHVGRFASRGAKSDILPRGRQGQGVNFSRLFLNILRTFGPVHQQPFDAKSRIPGLTPQGRVCGGDPQAAVATGARSACRNRTSKIAIWQSQNWLEHILRSAESSNRVDAPRARLVLLVRVGGSSKTRISTAVVFSRENTTKEAKNARAPATMPAQKIS